jgi:hypothetical protein
VSTPSGERQGLILQLTVYLERLDAHIDSLTQSHNDQILSEETYEASITAINTEQAVIEATLEFLVTQERTNGT